MKKKREWFSLFGGNPKLNLSLKKMKLTLIFTMLVFLTFGNSFSQSKVTLQFEKATIQQVLKTLEDQTGHVFLYKDDIFDPAKKYSVDFTDESFEEVLESVCETAGVDYEVRSDRQIILTEKGKETVTTLTLQQRTVTGVVTDQSGQPLPGVTVVVAGTTTGTVTNADGNFSLAIPDGAETLQFSFVGMRTQEVPIEGRTTFTVVMEEETIGIDEVVAIGYGTAKKSDVTGSVGSVKSELIVRTNPTQPASALQGQVAGVNVKKINSQPGSDYTIDIRGVHSISFSSEPLVVIDGVMGGKLNTLNPSDIETMDVLKDASATAIYGARGANGVIIVTTKKGVAGKTKVSYDGYVGVKVPQLPDLMTAQEFYHAHNNVVLAENPNAKIVWTAQQLANVESGSSVNWVDEVTDPSIQTSHVVALSGGNENTTHYFSAGYLNEKGNLLHTGYERYNLKGSMDSELNDVVKVGFTTYYTFSKRDLGSFETLRSAYRARPTGTIYYDDLINPTETNDRNVDGYAMWMGIKDTQVPNPLMEVRPDNYQDERLASNFLGNGYVEITPLKGLSFKSSLSTSVFNDRNGVYRGTDSKSRLNKLPIADSEFNINSSYTLDNILSYQLRSGMHNLNVTAAQSALKERFESASSAVENLPYNSGWYAMQTAEIIKGVGSRLIERSILSYMGRLNYSFNDKYLMTLTGRYDGSSVLAEGNKWAFFPSVALAWRAGEETFIKNMNTFSDLKFRLSYGEVGNDVVPPYSTQAFLAQTAYDFDGNAAFGYAPQNIGNSSLKWERSSEINLGIDLGFAKNRIMASIEYYNKTTEDLIQNVAIPSSLGFSAVTANVGKILNRGVEISFNTVNIQTSDIRWTTNINFSTNHNEIIELYGGTVTQDIANNLFVGESLRSHYYYKFDGIWQLDEVDEAAKYGQIPGSVKVVDQNNDGKISSATDEDDRIILGNELPQWMAGINNTFSYKNWDFSAFIYTRQGVMYRNSLLGGTMGKINANRYNALDLNYWTETNPTNDYFGVWQPQPYRTAIEYMEANFLRISNLTLGYSLPKNLLDRANMSNVRFYVQANNPFVFVKDRIMWMDPEYNNLGGKSGTYRDDLPSSTYIFGVNVSF